MKRGLSLGDIAASVGACSNAPSTQVRNSSKRSKKSVTSENIQSCTCGAESKITELSAQVMSLQQSVKELSSQVSFLLSFVGAVEPSPVASLQESQTLQTSVAVSVPAASNSSQQSNMESTSISSSAGSSLLPRSYAATVTQPSVTKSAPVYKAVLSAVYSELSERTRRSRNMVITGLPTVHGTVDKDLFTDLCVTEFGVNPNIAACRRLGRVRDDGRARPLLITMDTATSATNLLALGRQLRQSSNDHTRHSVYFNADMTKEEAKAAYDERVRRREAKAARTSMSSLRPEAPSFLQPAAAAAVMSAMTSPTSQPNLAFTCQPNTVAAHPSAAVAAFQPSVA